MHQILDISRLLFGVQRTSPSGIDRVELAYARRWLRHPEAACSFAAQSPWGWFAAIRRETVAALVEALETLWREGPAAAADAQRCRRHILGGLAAAMALGMGRQELRGILARHRRAAFLLVSHRGLDRPRPLAGLRAAGAAFVPLIHDLIPLTHPEYARPAQVARHARRIASTAALADGILANSGATAAAVRSHLGRADAAPPLAIAPLGLDRAPARAAVRRPPPAAPYFVCLGTIEPRKNHLLLLHLWRALAAEAGPAAPRLVLVGRRGWENENILDLLDRCPALRGLVEERRDASDPEVTALLRGSRALLFPSFAEGYGLPLAEALALGVPAVCSDIPALREVGGAVPDYLDPLDGPAWRRAVADYARPQSPRREAQLARLGGWRPPSWDAHFAVLDGLLAEVARARAEAAVPGARDRAAPAPDAVVDASASLAAPAANA